MNIIYKYKLYKYKHNYIYIMNINIITSQNNYGLYHDFNILKEQLSIIFDNKVKYTIVNFNQNNLPDSDINIFLEVVSNLLIKDDRINILIPNQEWFYKTWKPYLNRFDFIFCKTYYAFDIFNKYIDNKKKVKYIGWSSKDMFLPNFKKDYTKCLHICGHSINKQTGVKKVVNIIKKTDIPSTPTKKLKLKKVIISTHSTN